MTTYEKRAVCLAAALCLSACNKAPSPLPSPVAAVVKASGESSVLIDRMREPIIVMSHVLVNVLAQKFQYTNKLEPVSFRKLGSTEPNPYLVSTWTK